MLKQFLNERLLAAKASQEGQISVHGFARLTPTLQRESPNKTELPALRLTDRL
jgi:hypothetical protein